MWDHRDISSIRRLTTEAVRESSELAKRSRQTVVKTRAMISVSMQLLSEWSSNGTPTLSRIQRQQFKGREPHVAAEEPAKTNLPRFGEASLELVTERDFRNETVRLGGKHFRDCTLINCVLEYWGGPVILEGTHFSGCRLNFAGEAAMTVSVLECFGLLEQQNSISPDPSRPTHAPARVN